MLVNNLTVERLKELVRYEPETEKLFWKDRDSKAFNSKYSGKEIKGSKDHKGYLQFSVDKITVKLHRVKWALHYGYWPKEDLDHINRDISDNSISNLRECSRKENSWNRGHRSNSTSGYLGVTLHKASNKYQYQIMCNGKRYYGLELTALAAAEKREMLAKELHKEFFVSNFEGIRNAV